MDKVNGITSGTPEDLALEGYLSRFFARKGITFDMESGLFRITNISPNTGRVTLLTASYPQMKYSRMII